MSPDDPEPDLFFLPAPREGAGASKRTAKRLAAPSPEDQVNRLSALGALIREKMEATGTKKWEVTLDGTLEVGTGILPGVKSGFKATIKFSSE